MPERIPHSMHLRILSGHCLRCNHRWTHQEFIAKWGPTGQEGFGLQPTHAESFHLEVTSYSESSRAYHKCYRCIDISGIQPSEYALLVGGDDNHRELSPPGAGGLLRDYTPRSRLSSRSIAHKRRLTQEELEALVFGDESNE